LFILTCFSSGVELYFGGFVWYNILNILNMSMGKRKTVQKKPKINFQALLENIKNVLHTGFTKLKDKMLNKKLVTWSALGVIVILLVSCRGGSKLSEKQFYQSAPDTFIQTIEVAGTVSPAEKVDLAFEKTGRLVELNLDINDRVEAGQVLAKLNSSEAEALQLDAKANLSGAYSNYSQYQAILESEKSKKLQLEADLSKENSILEQMKIGATAEEILVAEKVVGSAESSVLSAEENLQKVESETDTLLNNLYEQVYNMGQESLSVSNDVITRITGDMFLNPTSLNPQIVFTTLGTYHYSAESYRTKAFESLDPLSAALLKVNDESSRDELDTLLILANNALEATRTMVNAINIALDEEVNLNDEQFTEYKSAINLASNNLLSTVNNLNNLRQQIASQKVSNSTKLNLAQTSLNDAQNALALAESELVLVKAGPTTEEINTQEAVIQRVNADVLAQDSNIKGAEANLSSAWSRIEQAKALVAKYDAEAEKNVLIAPISGKITARDYSLGEIVQANVPVYKLSSSSNYEIIADIPEMDIPKVSIGNEAEVYLDSYGRKVLFKAVITEIEPSERIVEGLAKYRITLQFTENDTRIKSGMTANLTIVVAEKENVISVPAVALIEKNGKQYIRVENKNEMYAKDSETVLKEVKVGDYSSDGRIEILNGLRPTDSVILD
jgi:RND family efflux transporter MFP subunit